MSSNIVTTILNMIAPALLDKIAAALGVSSGTAKAALAAAVPAVLGAIGSKASTEVGARALFDAVSKTDTSSMGDLASTLSGASGGKFLQGGLGSLGSLLGDNALGGLTSAIGKQTGLDTGASSSIVGLASSLAMGQLAKSVTSSGLNASSLSGLLSAQQGNIASALPAGLGSMLSGAGVLGGDFAGQASRAVNDAARSATAATAHAANAAKKSGTNWLAWIIPLAIVAAAAWYFLGQGSQTVKDAAQQAAGSATSLVVDGVDLNGQLSSAFDGLKSALGGITDVASAQAALPKLEETAKSIDGLTALMGKLSPEQRTMVAGLINGALPTLKDLIAKVLAIPGVGDVVKPTADALMAKIEALANPA
jgi:hypothetical protein